MVDFEAVVAEAPDALILADREGVIRAWNAAAERVFGFSSDEALGETLDLIVPERFREQHWTGYDRALADDKTKYEGQALPTRAQRKDGEQIYVELSFAMHHEGGELVGVLAAARDITERFASDRDQRRKMRELEEELASLRGGE